MAAQCPAACAIVSRFWLGTACYVHYPVILNPSGKGKLSKRTQAFLDSGERVLVRADEFARRAMCAGIA